MNSAKRKQIIISVTNDLTFDQRVDRIANTLLDDGFEILLVGRLLSVSKPLRDRRYKTHRMKVPFNKGFLFYSFFNIWLFFFLLFKKFDILLANDLDTLPANFIISKLRSKSLFFDSHEYFPEVPELINRPGVKNIWIFIEKLIIPHLKHCYTVCQSIANLYKQKYNIDFAVVRNLPFKKEFQDLMKNNAEYGDKKIILYQGWLNEGRGLELMLEAIKNIDNVVFLIAGDGTIESQLHKKIVDEDLSSKVVFLGRIPFEQLHQYTLKAHLGISIEENYGLNYYYALPNKLFDYIQARLPVLVSDFPEMGAIVRQYNVGLTLDDRSPEKLCEILKIMLFDEEKRSEWKGNLKKAASELVWENEKGKLLEVFKNV